jgi:hypothetical protein
MGLHEFLHCVGDGSEAIDRAELGIHAFRPQPVAHGRPGFNHLQTRASGLEFISQSRN